MPPALTAAFEHNAGHGGGGGMRQGKGCVIYAEPTCAFGGAPMESQRRSPTWFTNDFDVEPPHSMRDAGTEGFGSSFFGGEASGEAFRGFALAQAVLLLGRGIDAVQKAGAETVHRMLDAGDLGEIDT